MIFNKLLYAVISFLLGTVSVCSLVFVQYHFIFEAPFNLRVCFAPGISGGVAGLFIGLWYFKIRKYNAALLQSEARYRDLFENANDLIQSIAPDGSIIYVNRAWRSALGYTEDEISVLSIWDVIHPDSLDSCMAIFQQLWDGKSFDSVEVKFKAKDGHPIIAEGSISCSFENGKPLTSRGIFHDITDRKRAEKAIHRLAFYDGLTGLPNKALFTDHLNLAISRADREQEIVGVLFLDLDRFKGINDTLGHPLGDSLLRFVAQRLKDCVRENDTVARLGGDDFALLLSGCADEEAIADRAQNILESLTLPFDLGEYEIFTSASIGIALYPRDGKDVETLLMNADTAMYSAKEDGGDCYNFYSSEMNIQVVERLSLENSLRRALEQDELFLHYQPQLDLNTGQVTGMEALLRWRHPERGLIPPSKFIPLAEDTGLILPIGKWVLRNACAQNKLWQESGYPPLRVAVNLSARQFKQHDLVDMVEKVLEETGLDPDFLELELTESTIMANADETIEILTDLKIRGVHLSIDDFGTGYSSLSYLKNFPIDRVKIAQEFVRAIPYDLDDATIVEAIIAMAHSLGLRLIAEGVETKEQLEFLRERRCNEMQGYYFGKPMSKDDFTEQLKGGMALEGRCPFEG